MPFTQHRRLLTVLRPLACLLFGGAFYCVPVLASPNPVPHIDSLSPLFAAPGGAQFTLTVNGTDFVSNSIVSWSGTGLATTYVSAEQLTAIVPTPLIATSGTGWITVTNPAIGGGISNLVFLPVGVSSAHVNFATFPLTSGAGALGVAQGDFNGDGKLDLVTANWSADSLSIFLSNGDGTFAAPQVISLTSTSLRPVGVSVGDFNNDGILDLAVGYETSTGVSILLGNGTAGVGDGTFGAPQSFVAGSDTYESVVGDFDGDGNLDMAVTNFGNGTVSVLLGNGNGTFQAAVTYPVNSGAFFIQEADLNGDGALDLVVGNYNSGSISVLIGNGDGTFMPAVSYTAGASAADVAIGDFNGDGIADLVVTSRLTNNMYLLLGNGSMGVGDGTFQTAQAFAVGFGTSVVAAADFNVDGNLDLAVIKNSGGVGVLLGNGDGTFQAAQSFTGASLTYGILLGNYNLGGGIGIATTDFNTGSLDVLLQTVSISPASINFGNQAVSIASAAQTFTITNSTSQLVTLSGITFTGTNVVDFGEMDNCGSSIASGASCAVQVTFTPGAVGSRTASLSVADDAPASPQTASVSGTGTAAAADTLSATALTFPNENVGATSPSSAVTITNTGLATLHIASIALAGTNMGDFSSSNDCGTTLAPSALCTITTTFTPTASGTRTASIVLTDDAPDSPQVISLSGQSLALVPTATLSAISLTYTQQVVASASAAQSVTLTNNGNTALTIVSIVLSGTNAADFAVTNNCGPSVAAAAHCTISATFTPVASGTRTAAIAITDNTAGSPQSISLSGTGQDFSLSLSTASPTVISGNSAALQLTVTPVAGFNQAIALTCTGAPLHSSCVLTPSSITPSGSPVAVTVTLTTNSQLLTAPGSVPLSTRTLAFTSLWTLLFLLFAGAAGLSGTRGNAFEFARARQTAWAFGGLLMLAALGLAACGKTAAVPAATTPAGSYTLTITATAGQLVRTSTVTLTVQ